LLGLVRLLVRQAAVEVLRSEQSPHYREQGVDIVRPWARQNLRTDLYDLV